jgi:hypothetical protein
MLLLFFEQKMNRLQNGKREQKEPLVDMLCVSQSDADSGFWMTDAILFVHLVMLNRNCQSLLLIGSF